MRHAYFDIDPQDIDPDTNRPYANYSSPSLDTSFHDGEMEQRVNAAEHAEELLEALLNFTAGRDISYVAALAQADAVIAKVQRR